MPTNNDRLYTDLKPGMRGDLKQVLPWGTMKHVVISLIYLFFDVIEREGPGKVITSMYDHKLKIVVTEECNAQSKRISAKYSDNDQ